jgi:hypothetical protein
LFPPIEVMVMFTDLPVPVHDLSELAAAGFLARYREPTVSAYRRDLRCFWKWCADHDLTPLAAKRPHVELQLSCGQLRGGEQPDLRRP